MILKDGLIKHAFHYPKYLQPFTSADSRSSFWEKWIILKWVILVASSTIGLPLPRDLYTHQI